jgi:hypothetical protein
MARWTTGLPLLAVQLLMRQPVCASFSFNHWVTSPCCVNKSSQRRSSGGLLSAGVPRRQSVLICAAAAAPKDWDAILAQQDDDEETWWKSPADMVYTQRNCDRANENFAAIVEAGGPAADVYGSVVTKNTEAVFWFLGKVAHVSDVTLEQCVARQWNLIQQHAANLRPVDLFAAVTSRSLDLWCAPANSELDVAYNRPTAAFTKMSPHVTDDAAGIKNILVGFQGEVYDRGEDGFRTWRLTANGGPARPEFAGPVEEEEEYDDEMGRGISDEDMAKIQKALEDKDINQVYEEQERRRRNNDST